MLLSWIGLRDAARHAPCQPPAANYATDWPGLIKPREAWGPVRISAGVLFDTEQLHATRAKLHDPAWQRHIAMLREETERIKARVPERDLGRFLPILDRRYVRVADAGRTPYYFDGLLVGFLGMLFDDPELIHLALRYLMCMLHTPHWTQSVESRLPGSVWDQRCFIEEVTTTSVSLLTDWFGDLLTERAVELARQSIWDKGLAFIERDMMKYAYIHSCSQGIMFSRARILGGILLERCWPHIGDYVDRAYRDLDAILSRYIRPDGGVEEGPGYFCISAQAALPALIAFARARGHSPEEMVRRHYHRAAAYASVMSGMQPGTVIPEGDCRLGYFCGDVIPILAGMMPDDLFGSILRPCLETGYVYQLTGTLAQSGGWLGLLYGPDHVPEPSSIAPTFSVLPQTGQLSSCRTEGMHTVLLHIIGSPVNPLHSHADKGAITLEVNSVPLLIERGMVRYDDVRSNELVHTALHNCLTPVVEGNVYPDQAFPECAVIPHGAGDARVLHVTVELSNVWREYMGSCRREIHSDSPTEFTIVDRVSCERPDAWLFICMRYSHFRSRGNASCWSGTAWRCSSPLIGRRRLRSAKS